VGKPDGLEQVVRRAEEIRTSGTKWPKVRRIAVVRNDRLGDLVATIPAIAAMRRAYPAAHLTVVTRPLTAPLARTIDGVDAVAEDPGTLSGLTRVLREAAPDLLVSIAIGGRTAFAAIAAGIPHRVGPGYRPYSPLFTRTVNEHRSGGERHEVEYALSYAHRSGASAGPASFSIGVGADEDARLRGWLMASEVRTPFVVVHPGSGGSCPAWPVERFLDLCGMLLEERRSVVLSVGPGDVPALMSIAGDTARVRAIPRFTGELPELAALLKGAALVVSNSTGPLHLAAALGTPTLALHAPWATCGVSRWGPYAANGWAIVAGNEEAKREPEVMAKISTDTVHDAVHWILNESGGRMGP
jgi:ADP-heptose:LPS heptosyltransferase